MDETPNPIAAQAMSAIGFEPQRMTPLALNNALVGPGGRPVRAITAKQRYHALLGWVLSWTCWIFALLTAAALITQAWPDAPWCTVAAWLRGKPY